MRNSVKKKLDRWKRILSTLDELGYMSTSQIKTVNSLGGVRNTQRILKELKPYVCRIRLEENVYYLSKKGRELVGSERVRKFTTQIDHYLTRSQFYAHTRPNFWRSVVKIEWGNRKVYPDAFYSVQGKYGFLEVDRKQKMSVNREKIRLYREYRDTGKFPSGRYGGGFPVVMFVTETDYRARQLRAWLQEERLKSEVILTRDIL